MLPRFIDIYTYAMLMPLSLMPFLPLLRLLRDTLSYAACHYAADATRRRR